MVPSEPESELKAFAAAGQTLNQWYLGAQALTLLRAASDAGVLMAAREACTAEAFAAVAGLGTEWVTDLCWALYGLGVLEREEGGFRLSADFQRLTDPDAPQTLANTLGTQAARIRALERCCATTGSGGDLPEGDALAVAMGIWGLPSSPAALASFAGVDKAMPEVRAIWERGGLHLELGCGAGRDLLHIAVLYPKVTVVGVDISGDALEAVRRQAHALGIADRVQLQLRDARTVAEVARFDTVVWSQMYFPAATRAETARVALRALKPGGYLLLPLQAEPPATPEGLRTPAGQQVAFSRLVYRVWGLGWYSARDIRAEMEGAGFEFVRVVPHPRTDYMLLRVRMMPDAAAAQA